LGVSKKEMRKVISEDRDMIDDIKKHTTDLQRIEYDNGRLFTSYLVDALDVSVDKNKELSYCAIDIGGGGGGGNRTEEMMGFLSARGMGMDEDNELVNMLKKIIPQLGFAVTTSKSLTDVRFTKGGDITDSVQYRNIKTADDLIKMVSYHNAEYVDPILKDYETLKKVFA